MLCITCMGSQCKLAYCFGKTVIKRMFETKQLLKDCIHLCSRFLPEVNKYILTVESASLHPLCAKACQQVSFVYTPGWPATCACGNSLALHQIELILCIMAAHVLT